MRGGTISDGEFRNILPEITNDLITDEKDSNKPGAYYKENY